MPAAPVPGCAAPHGGAAHGYPGSALRPPASLSAEIARSDPRNPDHQAMLLARIRELRSSVPADARNDVGASLEMASTLTQYLIRMGGLGPEDIVQIVAHLVGEAEMAFAEMARARPRQVVLSTSKEASDGSLRLVGQVSGKDTSLLGEIMVQLGFCTRDQLKAALKVHKATGVRIGEALVNGGATSWEKVKRAVSIQNQIKKGG